MPGPCITVFGGTGFLGRHVVRDLLDGGCEVRIAARHPDRDRASEGATDRLAADVRNPESVRRAVEGAEGVVNAVGLYVEGGGESFEATHVSGARRVAEAASDAGARLVHVSGIGADPDSGSAYIRARAEGEAAVREACPGATVLRPSVLFGTGDAFLNTFIRVLRLAPVFPLFGDGGTRLQPVHVDDVAEAAARALRRPDSAGRTYELGGPDILTFRELIELIMRRTGRRRPLVPWPLALWEVQARVAAILPNPPLTRDQVALLKRDNVADPELPGLADLGIAPTSLEAVLALYPWQTPRQP